LSKAFFVKKSLSVRVSTFFYIFFCNSSVEGYNIIEPRTDKLNFNFNARAFTEMLKE
jgi:hypothetical protein